MERDTTTHRRRRTDGAGAGDGDGDGDAHPGRVTGPHAGRNRYGRVDHYFWRCETCGLEATAPGLRDGCPRCRVDPDEGATPGSVEGGDDGRTAPSGADTGRAGQSGPRSRVGGQSRA
jgi:hypothetical protein